MARRHSATIVALDVVNASKDVFASSMKSATVSNGFDVLLTDIGDGFVAEAATEKGEVLLAGAGGTEASADDIKKRQAVREDARINRTVQLESIRLRAVLHINLHSPIILTHLAVGEDVGCYLK